MAALMSSSANVPLTRPSSSSSPRRWRSTSSGMSRAMTEVPIFEPRIRRLSEARFAGSMVSSTPIGGMPTMTSAPVRADQRLGPGHRCRRTRGDEHVVGEEAIGEGRHRRDHIRGSRVDGVGCAQPPGEVVLGRLGIDGDDDRRAGEGSALDDVQPDATAPDHDDGRACLHPGGVPDGAHARDHPACEKGSRRRGDVVVDRHDLRAVHHDLFGEAADPGSLPHGGPRCVREWRSTVEGERPPALDLVAPRARPARPARADQGDDHWLPHRQIDPLAALDDGAHGLVPVHGRQVASPFAVGVGHVRVTDGDCSHLHPELAGARVGQHHVFDGQGLPEGVADGSADGGGHGRTLPMCGGTGVGSACWTAAHELATPAHHAVVSGRAADHRRATTSCSQPSVTIRW